jgi:hypothetical protein
MLAEDPESEGPWRIARTGIFVVQFGFVLWLVGVAVVVALSLMGGSNQRDLQPWRNEPSPLQQALPFALGFAAVGAVVLFVGQCLCAAVPRETGARGLVVASVLLLVFAVLLVVLGALTLAGQPDRPADLLLVLSVACAACLLLAHVTFILFLRAIGGFLGRRGFVQGCTVYAVSFVGCILVDLLFSLLVQGSLSAQGNLGGGPGRWDSARSPQLVALATVVQFLMLGAVGGFVLAFFALTTIARGAIQKHLRTLRMAARGGPASPLLAASVQPPQR